jgi:hypothetical protein
LSAFLVNRKIAKESNMGLGKLPFNVTDLSVTVEEGVKLKWQGREIDSGRLTIKLGEAGSAGVIDYEEGKVNVEFRVLIQFPELSEILDDMGAEPELTVPVEAVVRSSGVVFDDHSFRLSGKADLREHELFDRDETRIEITAPTRCKPGVEMTGDQIRETLLKGQSVSWNFNPTEKRVILALPKNLGGETHHLCLAGSYTFTAVPAERATAADAPVAAPAAT